MPTPSAAAPPAADLVAAAEAHLDRRLDGPAAAPVALALSGGGDSLALLLIVAGWARRRGRPLLALTIDHQLNPESAAWTRFAGDAARRAGAAWRGLAWTGPKPVAGLPEAAREARHRLLAEAARAAGARVILTGHTADDIAEADAMRLSDAPGLGRLRPWSPSPAWPEGRGIFLLRPLLDYRRAALRAWLTARGEAWLDDPANQDPRFARARARRRLEGGAASADRHGQPPPPPIPGWRITEDGRVILPRGAISAALLAPALLCAAGTERPPRGVQLERLLHGLEGTARLDATLAGARLVAEAEAEAVQIGRDAGERFRGGLRPLTLTPGEPAVWDGRFTLTADAAGLAVGPLGGAIGRLSGADRALLKPIPAWARGALPALFEASGAVRLPRRLGDGPAAIDSLAGARLAAACDLIARESEIGGAPHGA